MTIELEIEKDIPLPNAKVGGRPFKYPLDEMVVGDSFYVPHLKSWGRRAHKDGRKFTTRIAHKDIYDEKLKKFVPTTGLRIWRIE